MIFVYFVLVVGWIGCRELECRGSRVGCLGEDRVRGEIRSLV